MKQTELMGLVANFTGPGRVTSIPTAYIEWLQGDYVAAAVLNDCVWATNWKLENGQDGWFWRSEGDWQDKRCLSRKQVVRAVDAINKRAGCELIARDVRKVGTAPVMHFRVDVAAFSRMVGENWILPKRQNRFCPKGNIDSSQTAESLHTETRTETQTERGADTGVSSPTPGKSKTTGSAKANADRSADVRLQRMVRAWAEAMGYNPAEVTGRRKGAALKAAEEFPKRVSPGDVAALVAYLRTVPYYAENPARLTMAKVLEDLLPWEAKGKPAAYVATGGSKRRETEARGPEDYTKDTGEGRPAMSREEAIAAWEAEQGSKEVAW